MDEKGHLLSLANTCFRDAEVEQLRRKLMPRERRSWADCGRSLSSVGC